MGNQLIIDKFFLTHRQRNHERNHLLAAATNELIN